MSVSLLAVAAVVVGVFFNRSRQTAPAAPDLDTDTGIEDPIQLEALRQAGI